MSHYNCPDCDVKLDDDFKCPECGQTFDENTAELIEDDELEEDDFEEFADDQG